MRKSKYTDSQIVSLLKEAEAGQPVKEMSLKCGISRRRPVRGSLFGRDHRLIYSRA